MFKLNPSPTFKAKVEIPTPGGKPQAVEFEFKHRSVKALDEWAKDESHRKMEDPDFVMELAVGWTGVDAEFNRESLAVLCDNYHGAAMVIWNAYRDELAGARLKN